jgi:two-component system phosphate regulon sensor histidine kinase PhoR
VRVELLRIVVSVLLVLPIGFWIGHPGVTVAVVLAGWLVREAVELRRLIRWSKRPLRRPEQSSDLWQTPTERLFRSLRGARTRARDLARQLRRLYVTTDALPDGAVMIRANGEIETFNGAAVTLLGLAPGDRGKNLVSLVRHPELLALIEGAVRENLIEIASPAAADRRLEIRRIPIDPETYLVLARDVTQLNRLLTMRQDFVANVSHELRTPLTVIMGYLETLSDDTVDAPTLRTLLSRLEPPTRRMKVLVDDLLLLTRLESNQPPKPSDLETVDMKGLFNAVVTDAKQLSGGRHELRLDVDPRLKLRGVERELHSMLGNLVGNAVRYSPNGGEITIRWHATETGARLDVEDHGIGISPENLSRITERFFRVDLASARVRGGTGLGLAIVKHVLKRHQSTLEVTSELGKGSRFACVFPRAFVVAAEPSLGGEQQQ